MRIKLFFYSGKLLEKNELDDFFTKKLYLI